MTLTQAEIETLQAHQQKHSAHGGGDSRNFNDEIHPRDLYTVLKVVRERHGKITGDYPTIASRDINSEVELHKAEVGRCLRVLCECGKLTETPFDTVGQRYEITL